MVSFIFCVWYIISTVFNVFSSGCNQSMYMVSISFFGHQFSSVLCDFVFFQAAEFWLAFEYFGFCPIEEIGRTLLVMSITVLGEVS